MEVSPFIPSERYWTEEKEKALISFFSENSCLWNHKSDSYKNRQLRWKTLEHLRILLSVHPPPVSFSVDDIKNKFKNLRTTFQRQYKLVKASKASGSDDVFVSQWKHYQPLMFLQNCWDQEEGPDDPPLPLLPRLPVSQEEPLKLEDQPVPVSFLPNTSPSAPSCTSSNMMGKCYWTEEKERALISFYSDHVCLWNKKSDNHNNRQLRLRTLETLRGQLSEEQPVPFTVEDIKSKFKNLRTVFNREYKAVKASRASDSDKAYVSQWKHYQQLLFLRESCDEDDEDLPLLVLQEEKDPEYGNHVTSSTSHSFPTSTTQIHIKLDTSAPSSLTYSPTTSTTTTTPPYRISLSAAQPESLKLGPSTLPIFLSGPVQLDAKPYAGAPNPSHAALNFPASNPVQPDARLNADTRCHWTEAKVRELISFYSEQSCLWNHRSESYRNRQLRQSMMETLSTQLSENQPVPFTVEDIKTKFRNLRTIFQREHKAVNSNKTCGSEDFYLPKWKHYRQLMFLCDSCDEDDNPEVLRFHQSQDDVLLELGNQAPASSLPYQASTAAHHSPTDTKFSLVPRSQEALPSPTPPASLHSSPSSSPPSPSTSSSQTDSKVSGRKRPSRSTPPPAASEVLDFMRSFYQNPTVSPHAGFLKYIEECLNETPPDKVKKLKKKIIETIHSVSEEL